MTFLSALILGLLASTHCAGMCGGLQMAIQHGTRSTVCIRSDREALLHLVLLNLGRLVTYVLAGIFFAAIGYAVLDGMNINNHADWMRYFSGGLICFVGLYLFIGKARPFQFLEPLGVSVWKHTSQLINHQRSSPHQSFISGMAWGFLPCGLVYSVLVASVFASDVVSAASIMMGFGLGTMPSLILTGLLYKRFKNIFDSRKLQYAGGVFFMFGGGLMLSSPYWVDMDFMYQFPQLINPVFCLN